MDLCTSMRPNPLLKSSCVRKIATLIISYYEYDLSRLGEFKDCGCSHCHALDAFLLLQEAQERTAES